MSETLHLENVRLVLIDKPELFARIWSPFIDYLKGQIGPARKPD